MKDHAVHYIRRHHRHQHHHRHHRNHRHQHQIFLIENTPPPISSNQHKLRQKDSRPNSDFIIPVIRCKHLLDVVHVCVSPSAKTSSLSLLAVGNLLQPSPSTFSHHSVSHKSTSHSGGQTVPSSSTLEFFHRNYLSVILRTDWTVV